ncbi:amino acid ABC transporter permease [Arthrobacter sp. UM1]|uniref:amino acid ABC transporter permease n=1 Tax=Arthrobacter sp. UM1 TaxID=2766776 RepID=UPI001CF6364E|nr:amino acid ABC transporter permease [Arthrobacter sp. UM1]MCB4207846.1 amino acid ABC transporter permease [Arthrobacter sp. UM1]
MTPNWELVLQSFWPILKAGLLVTIPLALLSFALGLVIALVLAVMRISRVTPLAWLSRAYVSVIRGTPMLVQLFVIFYGLPNLGITLDPWTTITIALSMNVGGYAAEVIRAAIESVPRGQWEAAHTIGMSRSLTLRRVILPQAARLSVPPLSNTFISLVKDTSLASLVTVAELFRKAQDVAAFSNEFLLIYMEAGLIYWIICMALSVPQPFIERRLSRHVAK